MKKTHAYRWCWMAVVLVGLSVVVGIGLAQIQPAGRHADVVQFDTVNELRMGDESAFCVVFARYWVCREFYALSVVWTEPQGGGIILKTMVILSDENGFRIENPWKSEITAVNSTYVKPLGEKGPYRNMGIPFEFQDIRFTEADAVSRRVYTSDLAALDEAGGQAERMVHLKVSPGPASRKRKLAELRVQAQGRRIASMELFDAERLSLGKMKYEYETDGDGPRLARLVADLPPRPVRLKPDSNDPEVDYVSHKGGRTCTVAYQDVAIGDRTLRLPTQIEVRATTDKQLLRSARLMNFKGVDLDKAAVWEAAKAFSRPDSEFPTWGPFVDKYLHHQSRLGPPSVDPNDLDFVRQLIAKYPVPKVTPLPLDEFMDERLPGMRELGLEEWRRQQRMRSDAFREAAMKHASLSRMMPRPEPRDIEPNDARLIRQLSAHYRRVLIPPLTEEERAKFRQQGWYARGGRSVPEEKREINDLRRQLSSVLSYHYAPVLPEDLPPALDPGDLEPIPRLQKHYEALAQQTDRGLGGQLRALHCLIRLDEVLKDYDAFETHAVRYLRLLEEADLLAMYMTGGCDHIGTLVEAGQYAKASRLLTPWAQKAAIGNDPDAIFHFARAVFGGAHNPWASMHLLERLLRRSGLSARQRYEALALHAIELDKIDKRVAGLETLENESHRSQCQWVLSETTRTALSQKIEPALRRALSAWQTLGSVDRFEAKPYSTAGASAMHMNMMGYPEATALQETSAQLDQIIQERSAQTGTAPPRTRR